MIHALHPFCRIDPTESVKLVLETLKLKVCIFLLFPLAWRGGDVVCGVCVCVRSRVVCVVCVCAQQGELSRACEDQRLTLRETSSVAHCIT